MCLNLTRVYNGGRSKTYQILVVKRFWVSVVAAFGLLAFSGEPAQAYIDPGTGGMLLQLLLGGVAGALVVAKLYWLRIKEGFQSIFGGGATPRESKKNDDEFGN